MAETTQQTQLQPFVPPTGEVISAGPSANRADLEGAFNKPTGEYQPPALPALNEQPSFWPMAIAIYAASKGNVGPLFQIQEQKRKTQVAQQMTPLMANTARLVNQGRIDEALDYLQQGSSRLGARVPELLQFVQPEIQRISAYQKSLETLRTRIGIEEDLSKTRPNYPVGKKAVLNAFKKVLKTGRPGDLNALQQSLESLFRVETREAEGHITFTSAPTGDVQTQAVGAVVRVQDIPDFTRTAMQKKYEMPINDIVNAANNLPVLNSNGVDIGPKIKENFYNDMAAFGQIERDLFLRKASPTSQEYNEALGETLRLKGDQDYLLTVATGNWSLKDIQSTRLSVQRFKVLQAEAPIRAALQEDVMRAQQSGLTAINIDPSSSKFGSPEYVTHAELLRRDDLMYIRSQVLDTKVTPALLSLQGLDYVDTLFEQLGDPDTLMSRLAVGAYRRAVAWSGFAVDDPQFGSLSLAKAAEVIVNRAIENVGNTELINTADVGELKALVTGGFADVRTAKQTVNLLRYRIKQKLAVQTGILATPNNKLPKALTETPGKLPGGQYLPEGYKVK